jgi:hypothetical protein
MIGMKTNRRWMRWILEIDETETVGLPFGRARRRRLTAEAA